MNRNSKKVQRTTHSAIQVIYNHAELRTTWVSENHAEFIFE